MKHDIIEVPRTIAFNDDLGFKEKLILVVLYNNPRIKNDDIGKFIMSGNGSTRQMIYNLKKKNYILKTGYGKDKERKVNWEKLSISDR